MAPNVISLLDRVSKTPRTKTVPLSIEGRATTVHNLVQPQGRFRVYTERYQPADIIAKEFFDILPGVGMITIVNREECIDLNSILRVEKGPGCLYELGVDDFIRLTEPIPGMIGGTDIDAYLIPTLNAANLQIGMITEAEDVFTESTMGTEDAEIFHADTRKAVWEGNFYACLMDDLDGEGVSFTVEHFTAPEDMPLLYLLCHAHQEYQSMGYRLDGRIQMELASYEGIYTHTRYIPIDLLTKIIHAGIIRVNPLYVNYSPQKRLKKFYEEIVYPLLSDEYLNGEEFEE